MGIRKLYEVWKKRELGWKLSKKIYLVRTYHQKIFYIKNRYIKELQIESKSYNRLEKEFQSFIRNYKYIDKVSEVNKTVWIFWMQGEENAPAIVRACISSVRKQLSAFNVVILSENNIEDYTYLPEHIMRKYQEGKITKTHFSDILRIAILAEHGGLWLDSTVLCTSGDFADKIVKQPLFLYKVLNLDQNDEEAIMASSWLISAKSCNPIIILTRDILYEYWKNHDYLINFFLLHLCLALAARNNMSLWENIPMYNNRSPHTLMFELGTQFSQDRWEEIKKISSFHKLTRHIEFDNEGTFYRYIIDSSEL